jgi:Tol biopolymer transport system component
MPATGGDPQLLTTSGNYNQEPDWCGRRGSSAIAYTRRYPNERYEVHVVDADSGEDRRLTQDGGVNKSPSWAPDCSLIVFTAGETGLHLISPDGRQRRQLYRGRALTPAWSRR